MCVLLLPHTGSLNKSSICPSFSELFLPGICKESISSALDLLEQNHEGGKSIADSLLTNLFVIFSGASAISKAYEQQDEECQENCKWHFHSGSNITNDLSFRCTSIHVFVSHKN